MEALDMISRAVKAASSVVTWGAGLQENTRKNFVAEIQQICTNSESAYDTVLARLVTVKDSFNNPSELAKELRAFAADLDTRGKFKPEHLCSQVDFLLADLRSYLNPLKYSISLRRIDEMHRALQQFVHVDVVILEEFDHFTHDLDQIATEIEDQASDPSERIHYAKQVINDFDADLKTCRKTMREAKEQVLAAL